MSEHNADPTSDVSGDHVDSPRLAPGQGDGMRGAMPKREAPKLGAPKRVTIMAPSREGAPRDGTIRDGATRDHARDHGREHSWEDFVNSEPATEPAQKSGNSRVMAIAVMIAVGITVGAVGGSMATTGLGRMFAADDSKPAYHALEEHIARLDGEITALRGEVDRNAKQSAAARSRTADRLEKIEKGQAEPAQKLAKLSETVEKLRTAPPPAPVAAAPAPAPAPAPVASIAPKEVTGSINAPAAAPAPAPKPDVARLPQIDGWRIIDVAGGGATIEGRGGIFEVYAGDPVPGLGRVDAIRKQDGRWTVVTSKGLIVAR